MASGGSYRIQSTSLNKEFEVPPETAWTEQEISIGLNGIPINTSYKIHTWTFSNLLCVFMLWAYFRVEKSESGETLAAILWPLLFVVIPIILLVNVFIQLTCESIAVLQSQSSLSSHLMPPKPQPLRPALRL